MTGHFYEIGEGKRGDPIKITGQFEIFLRIAPLSLPL